MKILLLLLLLAQDQVAWKDLKKSRRALVDGQLRELPKEIQALEGKWVAVSGFLFVSHGTEGRVREVVLAEQQLVPPTPFDSIRLTFDNDPKELLTRKGLTCSGYFRIIKEFRDEKLVRLFALTNVIEGVVPEPKGNPETAEIVHQGETTRITFAFLERVRKTGDYPPEVLALNGKTVTITGNVLVPFAQEDIEEIILAKNPWDGCCLGVPPTPYDSVDVKFKPGATLKDKYAKYATITGTFRVEKQEAKGYLVSLFQLTDAYEGVPEPKKSTPWFVFPVAVGSAVVIILALRRKKLWR